MKDGQVDAGNLLVAHKVGSQGVAPVEGVDKLRACTEETFAANTDKVLWKSIAHYRYHLFEPVLKGVPGGVDLASGLVCKIPPEDCRVFRVRDAAQSVHSVREFGHRLLKPKPAEDICRTGILVSHDITNGQKMMNVSHACIEVFPKRWTRVDRLETSGQLD
eukprot:scaffold1766_cov401-Prasinococcus_capsulatus_cf.AAC.23